MLKITADSHVDHSLTPSQIEHLLSLFKDTNGFQIATVTLPVGLGTVPCGLYGPTMGDTAIPDMDTRMEARGERAYTSRVIVAPMRPVRFVTVIMGPHESEPCILYTAFGGPLAPKEPNDPTLTDDKRDESIAFWSEHALVRERTTEQMIAYIESLDL